MAAIRPVLVPSRLTDPPEKVGFLDDHWIKVEAGRAVADITDDAIYLTFGLRNVGSGLAVLDRWDFIADLAPGNESHGDPQGYRRLTRDLYIPGGDLGFWQGAFRDPDEPVFKEARDAITARRTNGDRPAVRRPRGRPAHDHPVRAHPSRRRSVDHVRVAALDPRSTRSALTPSAFNR